MNFFFGLLTISILAALTMTQANADDAEIVLSRAKKISDMRFRAEQLSLQASMADSIKKMSDAKFLVDEDGKLVGVSDMNELGKEFRKPNQTQGPISNTDMPFNMPPMGMPTNAPFTLEQPTVPAGTIVHAPQSKTANGAVTPLAQSPQSEAKTEEKPKPIVRLIEIRASSVLVENDDRLQEIRLGQKLNGETLKNIDVSSATFAGSDGPRILKFNWSSSKPFGTEQ
jgi:hypothetical protein